MADVKWIKLNVDMFDDEKIKIIQAMPDGDSLLVVWIKLITLAGKTNDGGYIYISDNIPYTEEMLSVIMNKPLATIRLAIQTFTSLNMLDNDAKGIYLVNFDKHQNLDKLAEIREYNRLAQQKSRAKRKALPSVNDKSMTSQSCQGTDIEVDKEKEKDKEVDVVSATNGNENTFEKMGGQLGKGVVLMTQQQQEELLDKLGFDAFNHYIEKLADFIIEKDAKVSNHYATILKWAREDAKV